MGANLTLKSAPGQGTVISIEVPAAEQDATKKAETQPAGPSIGLEGLRVWLVEDDPLVRNALEAQFTAWGVDFAFALNRAEVDELRDSDGAWPDAVILDDMLTHGERGLEIARWLAGQMPADRIVMVTGNVEPASVQALASSGFRNLRKPLSSAVLAQVLQEATRDRSL
jgi:CheY-like chemotaxis protein